MSTARVGVDSGGTRTTVTVQTGNTFHEYESEKSLGGALSPLEYDSTLLHILGPAEAYLLAREETVDTVAVFVSAAGFTDAFRNEFHEALARIAPDLFAGKRKVLGIANDATSLLLGHGADAIVIAGTGSSILVRDQHGDLHQASGHEWVASDFGSGFWIALRAIRQVYRDNLVGVETELLRRFRHEYEVSADQPSDLIATFRTLAIIDDRTKAGIARFSDHVCRAAAEGDPVAQAIVEQEAEELAGALVAGIRNHLHLEEREVRVVTCGGLFNNALYAHRIQSTVAQYFPIQWNHVTTGTTAALNLAAALEADTTRLLELPLAYRPLILSF